MSTSNPERALELIDGPVTFAGAVSLAHDERGVHPWRLQLADWPLYEPPLRERAADPAGVRLTFVSDTANVALEVVPGDSVQDRPYTFDLLIDGVRHDRQELPEGHGTVRFTDLPAGEHRVEIYLPQRRSVRVVRLAIDASASAKRWDDPRPKWLVYGSSITQCGEAAGPSETWPALVANRFDLNLTCLGYGGNCHMEPVVARMMRDLDADYISLCLGINTMGGASYSPRTFRAAVLGTLLTLRDGHPATPMVVVSPICSPPRETTPNAVGLSLADMRELIAEAVDVLRQRGDGNAHYVDGLSVFGPEHAHHMPDDLHPDAEGYRVLAARYAEVAMPMLGVRESGTAV